MSALDDLLARVQDTALRDALTKEFNLLRDDKQFGLVFERHLPESVLLPNHKISKGSTVVKRDDEDSHEWFVRSVAGETANITRIADGVLFEEVCPKPNLVVTQKFGEPIYPGLESVGKIQKGGDKPYHSVINAENYHALQALLYPYEGKVDCIYIDPPYNTGAKDWKYNNDYVDGTDSYRHSKWLSFMEKRLLLAKRLLNPDNSVLIVTIDEKEYLRLGMLLEQVFTDSTQQMISVAISPSGVARGQAFRRSDEYIFIVYFGNAHPFPLQLGEEWLGRRSTSTNKIRWNGLMRTGTSARRADSPNQFYPVYLDKSCTKIIGVGEPLPKDVERKNISSEQRVEVWPIRSDGSEGRWQLSGQKLLELSRKGYVKLGKNRCEKTAISYLKTGEQKKVESGIYGQVTMSATGHILVEGESDSYKTVPTTQWNLLAHSAAEYGSTLLTKFIPLRKFPFPKSLYAVEDILRFFVTNKPNALIVDFFSGSGTTAHAVMRLNRQDGGSRQSISITNNEVSADEQKILRRQGIQLGTREWERLGICEYITIPRIRAAITGLTPDGDPIKGNYRFNDEFPISEGFAENVEFFKLTYENRDLIMLNKSFTNISPLLWMKAGAVGPRIEKVEGNWSILEGSRYGVLFNATGWRDFVDKANTTESVTHTFIITDSDTVFQQIAQRIAPHIKTVRLYESYLDSFETNVGDTI